MIRQLPAKCGVWASQQGLVQLSATAAVVAQRAALPGWAHWQINSADTLLRSSDKRKLHMPMQQHKALQHPQDGGKLLIHDRCNDPTCNRHSIHCTKQPVVRARVYGSTALSALLCCCRCRDDAVCIAAAAAAVQQRQMLCCALQPQHSRWRGQRKSARTVRHGKCSRCMSRQWLWLQRW